MKRTLFILLIGASFTAAILCSVTAHAQTYPYYRDLTIGNTGADVSALQQFLIGKGFLVIAAPTGYFGPLTQAATAEWQFGIGLPSTGYFGPLSRAAIASASGTNGTGTGTGTATPPPSTNPSSGTLNYNYGFSVGGALLNLDSVTLNADMADIASLHVGWLRFDIDWANVQPDKNGAYDWSAIDRFVAAANAYHIKVLPILGYTPAWARTSACTENSDHCAPNDPSAFGAFAKAAALRYSSQGVHSWEIWNEPNSSLFWSPAADPATYTAILKASYGAIKGVDPSATVISGGMAPEVSSNGNISPIDFLSNIYSDGAGPYFDAVGIHPYSYSAIPSQFFTWSAWSQIDATSPSLRSIMVAHGDSSKQIWITEVGAPTGGPGNVAGTDNYTTIPDANHVTEALQALILSDAFTSASKLGSWAGPLFWYSYKDLGTSQNTVENFFGVIRYDGTHKPAYDTLKSLLAR